MIGKTLGNFQCTFLLGRGGMGEVYQAKDQKLGRDVAIKVLPQEFAQDTDRVARFQREAKLLASLNHPNIAAIYGLEESDGTNFLVMELVEGDTLADQIKKDPIPVEEALKLALQIAEALEAAHEKGVIHRDLKPANIKVTPDGKVKVLDFGLAKAYAGSPIEMSLSNSPTLSDAATQQGVILGTAAYMSPEQARGNPVDKRADIWAFGVVLFEMLTGRQIFSEGTVSDTLASVLKTEPKWDSLPQKLHPRIRLMLEHCLEKDIKSRSSGIGEIRADINKVLADPSGVFAQPVATVEPKAKQRQILLWASITVILIIIAGIIAWNLKTAEPRQVISFDYELPEDQQFYNFEYNSVLAVSPDGKQFVYSTREGLYLRSVKELKARLIPGTEDDNPLSPFFSPDGQWVGYWSQTDQQLKKVAIGGGASDVLCDAERVLGATWYDDNTIIYAEVLAGSISRVSADGGTPEKLVLNEGQITFAPQLLPDGKTLLFTSGEIGGAVEDRKIVLQSLETEERRELFAGQAARYLPTGQIFYAFDGNLYARQFDLGKLKVTGDPVYKVEDVLRWEVSGSGTMVYIPGRTMSNPTFPRPQLTLVWVDQQGKVEEIAADPDDYANPSLSPDGTKVAVTIYTEEGSSDIHILDLDSETPPQRLTFNESSTDPLWTPDGQRVVFLAGEGDERGIYWKAADGRGKEELLALVSDGGGPPWSWADDGKTLVTTKFPLGAFMRIPAAMLFRRGGGMGGRVSGPKPSRSSGFGRSPGSEGSSTSEESVGGVDIGTLSMEGDNEWQQLLHLPWNSVSALQISPDGKWMAYSPEESGGAEVNVHPFPDVDDGKSQIPGDDAMGCLWSPDGRELFYTNREDGSLKAIKVETEPTFKFGKSEVLFNPGDIGLGRWSRLAGSIISPVDKRFLMLKEVETEEDESRVEELAEQRRQRNPRKIIVVINWFEELKEKVPVD